MIKKDIYKNYFVALLGEENNQMHHLNSTVDNDNQYEIMTPKQVAYYLKISPRTVYSRWEKLGGLRIGRTIRFRKEVIDALFRPEEKKMEGGGKERRKKVYAPIQGKDGSKTLGNKKTDRI